MNHTPTPWHVGENGPTIYDANGRVVANCSAVGEDLIESIANAQRIVMCVNACAGLADPAQAISDLAEELGAAIERNPDWRKAGEL